MRDRIWFAQLLRGVAALIVMYRHLAVGFWIANAPVAAFAGVSPLAEVPDLPHHALTRWLDPIGITGGPLGVGIFFLISGFVIPFSLDRLGPWRFLIQRAFRLYPTYAVGLGLTCGLVAWYSATHGLPFKVAWSTYFENASLARDWFKGDGIDGIVWTLEVELKFYLLCAAICTVASLRSSAAILAPMFALTLFCCTADFVQPANRAVSVLAMAAPFLPFMFLGTCFYNLQHRHWSPGKVLAVGAVLAGCSIINFGQVQLLVGLAPRYFFASYSLALVIFALAYAFQHRIPYSRCLNWLAEISYPLYVVHGVSGYVLLTVLMEAGCPAYPAIAATVATALGAAYLLHIGIEKPSLVMAKRVLAWKRIAKRYRPSG